MLSVVGIIGPSILLQALGNISFQRPQSLQTAPFFYELVVDPSPEVALLAVVPGAPPGGKTHISIHWLDLEKKASVDDRLDSSSWERADRAPGAFELIGSLIVGDRAAAALIGLGDEVILVTKKIGGQPRVVPVLLPLGLKRPSIVAVRHGPGGNLLLLGTAGGQPVVLEINQEGQSVRELKIAVSEGGVALAGHPLAKGTLAIVGASGLASSPRAVTKSIWIAIAASGDEPVRIREWAGSKPRLVPLPTQGGIALLYVAEDGDDRIEFLDDRGDPRYSGIQIPRLSDCGATAVGSEELLLSCNDGGDSRYFRAMSNGVREEARFQSTNRVRPPILFAQKGILHEVTIALEATGTLERLLWQWSSNGR